MKFQELVLKYIFIMQVYLGRCTSD